MHELAKVSAVTTRVAPGHEAVRELAVSGTPIVAPPPRTFAPDRPAREERSYAGPRKPYRGRPSGDRQPSGRGGSPAGRGTVHRRPPAAG
jgi:hypothetical protein